MGNTVSFTIDEINQILGALGKIPAEHSMNLIMFIKATAERQLPPAEAASAADESTPE